MTDKQAVETIPLVEEELRVERRALVTGKVRVRSVVDQVEEIARATLEEEQVQVTRVPIEREVTQRPTVRQEGDVTIVPLLEEVVVVEKKLILREELHIRRLVTQQEIEVPVSLRKERAVVERVSADPDPRADEERN
jgi:stress response protein YsnF